MYIDVYSIIEYNTEGIVLEKDYNDASCPMKNQIKCTCGKDVYSI